ncbi:MAG TPA: HIT domain-containing protein [Pyrinomonadaceae bacterium]|nr:HIT domain-containing protein [Pyrinomonadaceae bacterium]
MDRLFTPWRYDYIKGESGEKSGYSTSCVFCAIRDANDDERTYVLHRAHHNFIVLNIYPYISGHLLIVPYEHTSELDAASHETTGELMELARRTQTVLREHYHPHGFNLGMNLGRAAGAGVAEHIHLHVMPRWTGDVNFMTTVGDTRVLPEDLKTTYDKLRGSF